MNEVNLSSYSFSTGGWTFYYLTSLHELSLPTFFLRVKFTQVNSLLNLLILYIYSILIYIIFI